jgi:curved DNA-binding protein CbpA
MDVDPYEILSIDRRATQDEIRAAYLAGAKRFHPDVVGAEESGERMRELNLAYEAIGDPAARAIFDVEAGVHTSEHDEVRIWSAGFSTGSIAQHKVAELNRERVRMEKQGWKVERLHDHLVCTRTDRNGLFGKRRKRRVTVSIDLDGRPFHVEQVRPD